MKKETRSLSTRFNLLSWQIWQSRVLKKLLLPSLPQGAVAVSTGEKCWRASGLRFCCFVPLRFSAITRTGTFRGSSSLISLQNRAMLTVTQTSNPRATLTADSLTVSELVQSRFPSFAHSLYATFKRVQQRCVFSSEASLSLVLQSYTPLLQDVLLHQLSSREAAVTKTDTKSFQTYDATYFCLSTPSLEMKK